jgi:hypothetical protein
MIDSLQEHDVHGAVSVDKNSVELDILDDGANNERVSTRLWDKVLVVAMI